MFSLDLFIATQEKETVFTWRKLYLDAPHIILNKYYIITHTNKDSKIHDHIIKNLI